MISLEQYWMGRDVKFMAELTAAIKANAEQLVGKVNLLLEMAEQDGVTPRYVDGSPVASGWRPLFINDATAHAASGSKHITGQAVDLRDTEQPKKRALARWCLTNLSALESLGLWMEDPRYTPTWVHLQCVPPGSGRRVYVPSTGPTLAAALKEQGGTA